MTGRCIERRGLLKLILVVLTAIAVSGAGPPALVGPRQDLDRRVRAFLDANSGRWRDLNVPVVDGQTLHDIIIKNRYTRALEIGTSTGHSGVWIAWALAKTGGTLVPIEIGERRQRQGAGE